MPNVEDSWDDTFYDVWDSGTRSLSDDEYDDFAAAGAELFEWAWGKDQDLTPEERHDYRELFETWVAEWAIDILDFDWDEWRDWYESA